MLGKTLEEQREIYYARKKAQIKERKREYILHVRKDVRRGSIYDTYHFKPLLDYGPPNPDLYGPDSGSVAYSLDELAGRIHASLRDNKCHTVIVYASLTDDIDNAPNLLASRIQVCIEDINLPVNGVLLDLQKKILDYFKKYGSSEPGGLE